MKVSEITGEMCTAISKMVEIDALSAEQVFELLSIPDVAREVNRIKVEDNKYRLLPEWAKQAGVTVAEWDAAVVEMQRDKHARSEMQRQLDEAAAYYRDQCADIIAKHKKREPHRDPKTARLVKAATATVSDLPINVRARLNLNLVGKTDDERSRLIADTLASYRATCVRRG